MPHFIAVDGESFTDTSHKYVLLASSTADGESAYEFDKEGLSTVRCLEFLLSHPKKSVLVGFGWNYDVNMILRDLDNESLIRLWKLGHVTYRGYTIEWIPSKIFTIKSRSRKCTVYDVFGFFQSSFIKALEAWGFGPQESIEAMKSQRSTFDSQMKQTVIDYCLEECNQLSQLCMRLSEALSSVQLSVSSWIGAGAIAASLLSKEGISDHHASDQQFPDTVYDAIYGAYYGGRVEIFQQGIFPQVWDYDVSSAYPSESIKLPSLTNGKWSHSKSYDPDAPYALWLCKWSIPDDQMVMPFPYRHSGSIFYPRQGEGWYHSAEVSAALTFVKGIKVIEGHVFHPDSDDKPFEFVPAIYHQRQALKKDGHAGEKVLKLGLNSLYGKLAQGQGYKGRPPKFQSFLWAGMITAGCRARVIRMIAHNPDALVMVATDGVFFNEPIDVDTTGGLGGLDLTVMDDVFIAQPGIYQATVDGKTFGKSRGFFTREINFDALREGYLKDGHNHIGSFESTRFNGLGTVMITGKKDKWRTWTTSERKLSLYPSRKFIIPGQKVGGIVRHHPADLVSDEISEPYKPKVSLGKMSNEELEWNLLKLQGEEQPMKVSL